MENDNNVKVSLTEFMRYISRNAEAKYTVAENASKKQQEEYNPCMDYWLKLRTRIVKFHKKHLTSDEFKQVIETVNEKMQDNYNKAVNGYLKFVGHKKYSWEDPPKAKWNVKGLSVTLNPEIGLAYKGQTAYIKLFLDTKSSINRSQANMIITLMQHEMHNKVGDNCVFAVLDVIKGKLFLPVKTRRDLYIGLLSEAEAFGSYMRRRANGTED